MVLCTCTTRWIIFLDDELVDHVSAWSGKLSIILLDTGGGVMGQVIRHPQIIWGGGGLDPCG